MVRITYIYLLIAGDKTFTWKANIDEPGIYEVFVYWPVDASHNFHTKYTITDKSGIFTVERDQTQTRDLGEWVPLGTYDFDSASNAEISLDNSGNGIVVADAVKIVYVP